MSIIKNINNIKPFESIPRELLQQCDKKRNNQDNKPLSLQAIGLLCNLQSYPENWELHKTELYSRYEKNGRRQIQNAWNELVDANYIVQFKVYDGNKLDYYYYFSVNPITDDQIKELEEFHNSERLNRFDLKDKNPTVQNEQYRHDGDSSTVHSVQYNLYSTDVNSTKRTDNIIHNQYNTHKQNTHEYTTHNNNYVKENQSSSSSNKWIEVIKNDLNITMTKKYKKELAVLLTHFNDEVITYAIEHTSLYAKNPKPFLLKILKTWKQANVKTVDNAIEYKVSKNNVVKFNREKTPEWLIDQEKQEDDYLKDNENDEQFEKERKAFIEKLKEDWGD